MAQSGTRSNIPSPAITEDLDLDAVLQGVLDGACPLTGARMGGITILDDSGQLQDLILSYKVCAGRTRTNVPTPGCNIQSLFRMLPQHTVALRCTKSLELPQNGFLRGNQDFITSGLTDEDHQGFLNLPGGPEFVANLSSLPEPLKVAEFSAYTTEVGLPEIGPPLRPVGSFLDAPIRLRGVRVGNL